MALKDAQIARAIAALTHDFVQHDGWEVTDIVPVLHKSIATELREIEASLGARGRTRLFAIAEAIDEALLALVEE